MTAALPYVIIGTGVAGIAAALEIRRIDSAAAITLLTAEREGYYSRPGLAYYLTGELDEQQLYPFQKSDWQKLGAQWLQVRAVQIDPTSRRVLLEDGQQLAYERLLIATGACATPLDLPGAHLEGIFKLDNLVDARAIKRQARQARRAVVIGGGITALEIVEGLRARGLVTHYLLRGERYWGNVLDESESSIVEKRLKDEGVQIHYQTEISEIVGKRNRAEAVLTRDGRTIKCDLVAAAIGITPRIELAQTAGLRTERGILVDPYLGTSDPYIYAAGDVAQVYDPVSGRAVLDSLWNPARQQGQLAGLNMSGGYTAYHKPLAFNVTRLADLPTTIIGAIGSGSDQDLLGIARGDSEVWRQSPQAITVQADFEVNRLRIMLGERAISGALLIGDQSLSRPLQDLITQQVDISAIRQRLLQPGAPLSDLIVEFWNSFNGKHDRSH